jgi:hypothetical protein
MSLDQAATVPLEITAAPPPEAPRRRRVRIAVLGLLGGLLVPVGVSYAHALTFPGEASVAVRTVDWVRDHGGGPVVDLAENWWYSRPPSASAAPAAPPAFAATPSGAHPPAALVPLSRNPTRGEGVWHPGPDGPDVWVTYLHPDPKAPSVLAAVARFDQRHTAAKLIAGTKEPAPHAADRGEVPAAIRPDLLATFNSGFMIKDSRGGYYADGHQVVPLKDGAASLVIDGAGRVTVGRWGRDVGVGGPGPDVTAVRQNLELIVDGGQPVDGLATNPGNRWGPARNQSQYTWRSAVGVDADGNLYYVAGDQLTLPTLARALADTGAMRGMELDIHPSMVRMILYGHAKGLVPTKLLPDMLGPATRYLAPDQRDFLAITRAP